MCEIKIRAWDKQSKKMRKVDSIAFDDEGNIKLVNLWGKDIIGGNDIIIQREKRFELLRFTGLKDKNGAGIYEGDILKGIVADKQVISNGIVVFEGCDYVVKIHEGSARGFYYLHHFWCDTIEIIGNIYEHPHLLGEAHDLGGETE